jgi:holo-[acyl-carrier protein] synthase
MPVVGVGIDLVDWHRVERLISRNEDIFRQRILGERERMEISSTSVKRIRIRAYASLIAAKEALLKALGTGLARGMRWPDIEVLERTGSTPRLAVSGETGRVLAGFEADDVQLSLSSVSSQAMALVVLSRRAKETCL